MRMAIGGRINCGKTTQLIIQSNHEWKYIVCLDDDRRNMINTMAMKMKLDIPNPIIIKELPLRSRLIESVLVDDVEDVVSRLIGARVSMFSTRYKFKDLII